jgi:formylglycine-generating enzyme required for sulfatase activity
VWEWVWDRYGDYPRGPQTDPRGPDAGDERVLRGGCHLSSVQELRSPYRIKLPPDESFEYLGLRLARSPAQ